LKNYFSLEYVALSPANCFAGWACACFNTIWNICVYPCWQFENNVNWRSVLQRRGLKR